MEYRRLGKTDVEVSAVALGCWALAGDWTWGEQDESQAIAAIQTALDRGINFFDTAETYGAGLSEERLGKGLAGRRGEAVIADKFSSGATSEKEIVRACEASLKRLGTDVIDLYQIHWPGRAMPIGDQLGALDRLREQGKIRFFGVCNFGPRDLESILAAGRTVQTNQLPYNLLWRVIEFEIARPCLENGIGILPYSPLMQGLLTGKFATADDVPEARARTRHFSRDRPQCRHTESGCEKETFEAIGRIRAICVRVGRPMAAVALAWLLQQPAVTSVLAGARNPEQVIQNSQAAELPLSAEIVEELAEVTEPLKQQLGPNPDMWQSESRFH